MNPAHPRVQFEVMRDLGALERCELLVSCWRGPAVQAVSHMIGSCSHESRRQRADELSRSMLPGAAAQPHPASGSIRSPHVDTVPAISHFLSRPPARGSKVHEGGKRPSATRTGRSLLT